MSDEVFVDLEIIKAIGLSVTFMGVMLSIITVGIGFLIYRISKNKGRQYLKMAGLVTGWAVFIALNIQSSSVNRYTPLFFNYSIAHVISILIGAIVIISFLFMLPNFLKNKFFEKRLLIIAGVTAVLGLGLRIINPFFGNVYVSLIQRVLIIIPPLLGFFMIVKSYVNNSGGKR